MFADPNLRTAPPPPPERRGWGLYRQPRQIPQGPPTPPRRRRSYFLIRVATGLVALALAGGIGLIAVEAARLPDTGQLLGAQRRQSVVMLATDGSTIASLGDIYGEPLHLDQMSKYLPQAVIATEDRRFYDHFGLDPLGIMRALWVDLHAGTAVQGGSTITQQLAKNLFLTPDRTLERKLQEAMLAIWLEHRFTKDQLLEIYLNRVYLGAGAYGVDGAAHRYFGKSARDLTPYEAAVIAGLLKAPSRYSPAHDRGRADARARQVLDNMQEVGSLSPAEVAAAEREGAAPPPVSVAHPGSHYFADWVSEQLAEEKTPGDLTVKTTLDPRLQALAEKVMGGVLARAAPAMGASQGALVALSPDGAVRAMVGGRDYGESQFNRATQAQRQPGSAFKPFVYLTALQKGLRPGDVFTDAPISIHGWQPHNYEDRYEGEVTMSEAVAHSLNTVAVQVAQRVGLQNVVNTAQRLGITSPLAPDPSLALGTAEVTLLELTSAYATFATGGIGAWAYGMAEVDEGKVNVAWRREGGGPGRLISAEIAGQMNGLLSGVIQHGTGKAAQIGRPAAGKTGTTSDSRDAWFVGYTPDLIVGVWLGNDDDSPTRNMTGGSLPAKIWHDFMLAALKGMPAKSLPGSYQPSPGQSTPGSSSPGSASSVPAATAATSPPGVAPPLASLPADAQGSGAASGAPGPAPAKADDSSKLDGISAAIARSRREDQPASAPPAPYLGPVPLPPHMMGADHS